MTYVPTLVNQRDFGYMSVPPKFKPKDFGTPGATPEAPEIVTDLVKPEVQWTDDERKLVNLDSKLKNMIVTTLLTDIMKLIIKYPSSKEIWDILCSMYEGSVDTIKTKKIDLKRAYENFFSLPDESLNSTYTRLKRLLNDITNVGITHDNFEVCHKFIDSLPLKWQNLRQILRTTTQIQEYDLEELFGVLQLEEKVLAQNIRAAADALRHVGPSSSSSSSSSIPAYSVTNPLALVSAEPINLNDGASTSNLPAPIQSLVDELDVDEKQEMFSNFMDFALLDGKKYSRKWNNRKSIASFKPPVDKSQEECWRCGRKGHYQKKCKRKSKILAKGLVAEEHDWADSDESDDEEYVDAMCLMALADGDALTKDQVSSSQWVNVTVKKVKIKIEQELVKKRIKNKSNGKENQNCTKGQNRKDLDRGILTSLEEDLDRGR
uniref:uncharacterized protein LOC122597072 n=1 Tax=Erigeron canadensis TaxID=72917 RepID=UPI001CB9CC60|nr:uncharacterized protein LOC122597072 [Erigeron canadensis]